MLYASTSRLQQHKDITRQELRTARLLCRQLREARGLALPEDAWRFDQSIEEAETLSYYFNTMLEQIDSMIVDISRASIDIDAILSKQF